MEIQEHKKVWVAWTNTDCTEGRGKEVVEYVCETEATARRLGKQRYIQGTNCPISESIAVKVNNKWLIDGSIQVATTADVLMQNKLDKHKMVLEKARAAGLTDEDIASLKG
jgi:uncharacterized protein (DUF2126 family)